MVRLNRETGKYEAQASVKFWLGLGAAVLTFMTAVVTYTITLTLAFGSVRQDIALLNQKLDLTMHAIELRLTALEAREDEKHR